MRRRELVPAALLVIAAVGAWQQRAQLTAHIGAQPPGDDLNVLDPAAASSGSTFELGPGVPESPTPTALHGGPARRHRAHGRGPRSAKVQWTRELGSPIAAQVVSSNDASTLFAVTLGGELLALEAASGEVRWRRTIGERIYGTPLVTKNDGLVFGADGGAVLSYAADGSRRWRLEAEHDCDVAISEYAGHFLTACGPALRLIAPNGTLRREVVLRKKIYAAPAVHGDFVYVGAQDGRVHAFSLPGLTPLWDTKLGADVDGGLAVADDGSVIAGTDAGEVVVLEPDGGIRWRKKIGAYVRGALSIARNGDILAGVMGTEPGLVRLSGTGEPRFRFSTRGSGAAEFGVRGGALEDDAGTLYFGGQDDHLVALTGSGEPLFAYDMGADVDAPLTLLPAGALIVAADSGRLVCLAP